MSHMFLKISGNLGWITDGDRRRCRSLDGDYAFLVTCDTFRASNALCGNSSVLEGSLENVSQRDWALSFFPATRSSRHCCVCDQTYCRYQLKVSHDSSETIILPLASQNIGLGVIIKLLNTQRTKHNARMWTAENTFKDLHDVCLRLFSAFRGNFSLRRHLRRSVEFSIILIGKWLLLLLCRYHVCTHFLLCFNVGHSITSSFTLLTAMVSLFRSVFQNVLRVVCSEEC